MYAPTRGVGRITDQRLSTAKVGSERIDALDGIRAVAVTAVVVYHLFPTALPGGFLGVDVFFVLSGYLITRGLAAEIASGRGIRLVRFWVRRAVRLLPALVVMLVAVTAVAGVVGGSGAVRLRPQVLSALTFTSNWYQADAGLSYFERSEPPLFQHLWSLAVEEQFYLVWPLLLVLILAVAPRPRHAAYVAAALACASAIAMAVAFVPVADPSRLYFGTDTHGFSLLIGAAAALMSPGRGARILPLVGLVGAAGCVLGFGLVGETSPFAYRGGIALVAVAAACVVVAAGAQVRLASVLATRPLVWLGRRSYGIYLWHWPPIVLLAGIAPATSGAARAAVVVGLTLGLAALSWRYVEQPLLRDGPLAALAAAAAHLRSGRAIPTAGVVTTVVAVTIAAGAVSRSPRHTEAEDFVTAGQEAIADARLPGPGAESPGTGTKHRGVDPRRSLGEQTTVIGDSVTLASADSLLDDLPGVDVRATVGEQMWDAPGIVERLRAAGDLRPVVVIALGTNGDFHSDVPGQIFDAAGRGHQFVFVTAHADRDWVPSVNAKLRALPGDHPPTAVADWDAASEEVTDFASDGIHPGPHGADVFADRIERAIRSLTER